MTTNSSSRLIPQDKLESIATLIAEGANFEGTFKTTQDQGIKIDGRHKGDITFDTNGTGGTVHVGPTGVIEGTTIEADYIFVEGRIVGKITARKCLEVTGSGSVVGDINYDEMIDVHPRARMRGNINFRGDIET